jgi:hypothetical protein
VVRGPAALLAGYALAFVYFLVAPHLPALPAGDAATAAADGVGLAILGACAVGLVGARRDWGVLGLLALGGGIVGGALRAAHVGPGADLFQVMLCAAAGMLFARILAAPQALVALPVVVAGIDAWSVFSGPSASLIRHQPSVTDFLTLQLPEWGRARTGQLGISDLVFLSCYAAWAWDFGLRRALSGLCLVGALVAAVILEIALGRAIPVLPLLAIAFLAPNLDRIVRLLGEERPTEGWARPGGG